MAEQTQTTQNVTDGAYVNFATNLGTERDKASHGKFVKNMTLGDHDFEAAYEDWLAKKIINRPVQDMLRAGWFYTGIKELQSKKMADEVNRLELRRKLYTAFKYARLYGRSYILIGFSGGDLADAVDWDSIRRGELQFFTVLKKCQVEVSQGTELVPPSENNGDPNQPRFYQVQTTEDSHVKHKVHYKRIIEIKNGEEGESTLLAIYRTLLHFVGTNSAAASLVHEAKIDVIQMPNLIDSLKNRMKDTMARFSAAALMKSINGMLVLDATEKYESKTNNLAGLPELMREYGAQTAAAADIPFTVLFGQTTSGLNNSGEFDLRNYYDRVNTDQEWTLHPVLLPLLRLIYQSLFSKPPVGMDITFYPLWQLDYKTRSEVEKNNAERDIKYLEKGIVSEAQVARQLREDGTYDYINDTHIKALEAVAETYSGSETD
ncbi:DUF1073 domain-containing protein [Acinetobacter indicus]|uniref:DUF1073 domain-containing protein n=1 Tax=Acinetobacter indicus TaxID=756892 RepID=UPI0012E19F15|nr:DUF1073 domain-containing protein [Acinetobacter indicus]